MDTYLPSPKVKSVFMIALPLIISGLCSNLTIFIDRIILAQHDTDMMMHVTTSSNFSWMLLFSLSSVAYVSKIYVGQYNGAKSYQKAGHITWQLILFSLLTSIVFLLAYQFAPMIVPQVVHQHGLEYFKILMLGGIFWPLSSAIIGFLIGTYQNYIVLTTLIFTNLANVVLDLLWIPEYGAAGAAYATIVAMAFQVVMLFWMLLSPYNKSKYRTNIIKLDTPLMTRAIKLGYPEAASHFFEMSAWAVMISIMANLGEDFLLLSTISQNLFILFMFTYSELGNAVKTLAANYVGAGRLDDISILLSSATKIHFYFVFILASISLLQPDWVIAIFSLSDESAIIQDQVTLAMNGLILFFMLDGIAYILSNLLAAFGDTFIAMIIFSSNMWAFLVLPTYLCANFYSITPTTLPLIILPLYGILVCSGLYLRYKNAPITFLTDQC
ncbi:MATE family efflux transporter [Gammaproteobacteria bacterium]|nr:MATE family efflux transporter [Gammaproteobacteria bacterium]